MKQGKLPTRQQKKMIERAGLDPKNWLVSKNLATELHLIHRETGTKRLLSY